MSSEQVAPETKGVTVKLLAAVDLGPEIEGMAGRVAQVPVERSEFRHKGWLPRVLAPQGQVLVLGVGMPRPWAPGIPQTQTRHADPNRSRTPLNPEALALYFSSEIPAGLTRRRRKLRLDKAFFLIEGRPCIVFRIDFQ